MGLASSVWGRSLSPYHHGMKTSYLFGAILACSVIGAVLGNRSAKTLALIASGALSIYGLARVLG